MNRFIVTVLIIAALIICGCTEKRDARQANAAQETAGSPRMQTSPAHGGASPAENPHANMKPQEPAFATDHKGKVVSTMNAAGYTYIEVEENGRKLWVAVMQVEVKPGDEVAFPDSPPVENFQSKTLNRTFDKIILAPAIQINGKPGRMGAHPKTR